MTREIRNTIIGLAGEPVPLVLRPGTARMVGVDDVGLDLLVGGTRVRLGWNRLEAASERLLANHTLAVDELGGGQDAVAIVSLLAQALSDDVTVLERHGLLVLNGPEGTPIHQYADMSGLLPRWPRRRSGDGDR